MVTHGWGKRMHFFSMFRAVVWACENVQCVDSADGFKHCVCIQGYRVVHLQMNKMINIPLATFDHILKIDFKG